MISLNPQSSILNSFCRKAVGQATLSTVLIMGGIMMLFATSLALIVISFVNSTLGYHASNKALSLAMAGVSDAELQLERNAAFSDSGYCVPAANTPCPASSTLVSVTQASPATGQVTVISDATVSLRRRKVSMIYAVSATSSLVTPLSFSVLTQ